MLRLRPVVGWGGRRALPGLPQTFAAFDSHRVVGRCLRPPNAGLTVAAQVWFGWDWPVRVVTDPRQAEDD